MPAPPPHTTDRLWAPGSCPFDQVIDVRSPGEFAADHLPGAVNLPVLSDDERAAVGTLHRADPFAARRTGAALVSANIARHLTGPLADRPKGFRPLVYCWRGGMRSASLAHVMAQIGWPVTVLVGGYETYRTHVRRVLDELPPRLMFRVLTGPTGAGKTRLLHRLAAKGGQVLDLEGLAGHRGSTLGGMGEQPTQKRFESLLADALPRFDPGRPVWTEAESQRIGDRHVPAVLLAAVRAASGLELRVPAAGRVRHLLAEYTHLPADPSRFRPLLDKLAAWHGRRRGEAWAALADAGDWPGLTAALLADHYDPLYAASTGRNYRNVTASVDLAEPTDAALDELADRLLAEESIALTGV